MGVIYWGVNHQTRECYELGKGAWILLTNMKDSIVDTTQVEYLTKMITTCIILNDSNWTEESVIDKEQHKRIALDLRTLGRCRDIEIINDTEGYDPEHIGYRNIGDIWHGITSLRQAKTKESITLRDILAKNLRQRILKAYEVTQKREKVNIKVNKIYFDQTVNDCVDQIADALIFDAISITKEVGDDI